MTQIITRTTDTDEVIGIYDVEIKHLRNPIADSRKDLKNWSDASDAWLVTINGQAFDYYTGIGHRVENSLVDVRYRGHKWDKYMYPKNIELSKPVTPKFDSILACLVQDAVGSAQTFDDWCSDYGYDTDSRKALNTYMACQEVAKKLRLAKVPLEKESERLQDY